MFNSNIHANKKEFHAYYTNDMALQAIGIGTYNISSLSGLLTRPGDNELKTFFSKDNQPNGELDTLFSKLLAEGPFVEDPEILKFNTDTKQYEREIGFEKILKTKSGNEVADGNIIKFLDLHNKRQFGIVNDEVKEITDKIQNSYSGGITFKVEFDAVGATRKAQIKLVCTDRFSNNSTERTIVTKGSPVIADIPRRITGKAYSHRGQLSTSLGIYPNPFEGGLDNPMNTIAAQLDTRYNSATGKWQAGTHQVLAKLLTDIDPANTPTFTQDKDTIDNTPISDFYNPESAEYLSQFTIGMALPLSLENGNPHCCGPNAVGCSGTSTSNNQKIEKILVVNRSGRSFKKGDTVLCSQIDNEWIVQGFDAGVITKPKGKFGRWQFQKYIADAENFMLHGGNPKSLESDIRTKYYLDMISQAGDSSSPYPVQNESLFNIGTLFGEEYLNDIAKLNLAEDPFKDDTIDRTQKDWIANWASGALSDPLPPYKDIDLTSLGMIRSTIFDQLGSQIGGLNKVNMIGRTSIDYAPDGKNKDEGLQRVYGKSIPFFWGPTFPDGYSSSKVSRLRDKTGEVTVVGREDFIKPFTAGDEVFSTSIDTNGLFDSGNYLFADKKDGNMKQLPAEAALNGSFDTTQYCYPIEDNPWNAFRNNYIDSIEEFINKPERYTYAVYDSGQKDYFDLSPLKPNRIQFSPLPLEFALWHTIFPLIDLPFDRGSGPFGDFTVQDVVEEWRPLASIIDDASKLLYYRRSVDKINEDGEIFPPDMREREVLSDTTEDGLTYLVPFNKFVENNNKPSPIAGPRILPNDPEYERSDVIGIIAAKNKFSGPTNGTLTIDATQYFGLGPRLTSAGGQGPVVTILGAFLSWTTGSNPLSQNNRPQWGDRDRSDSISSFGTTAMHFRAFDEWPDRQTIYDGRNFTVTHLNPFVDQKKRDYLLAQNSGVEASVDTQYDIIYYHPSGENKVYIEETSVDIRVPTGLDGLPLKEGTVIESGTFVASREESFINPIRRGRLVSNGGFRYFKSVIGLGDTDTKIKLYGGTNFSLDQVIDLPKNIVIKVNSLSTDGAIADFEIIDYGEGLFPLDFAVKTYYSAQDNVEPIEYVGYPLSIPNPDGTPALFVFPEGKVRKKVGFDKGPEEIIGITRLTSPSNEGVRDIDLTLTSNLSIQGGTGKYDGFYFFHNDILHTLMMEQTYTNGIYQHVTLELTTE